MTSTRIRMTHAEWLAEGTRRFGSDMMCWRFACPVCKHVASVQDYKEAGAPETAIAFSCVGRWKGANREAFGKQTNGPAGPCNYAGGGLFAINPVTVLRDDGGENNVFAFAE